MSRSPMLALSRCAWAIVVLAAGALWLVMPAHAQSLGPLFYTPQQRQQLDELARPRNGGTVPVPSGFTRSTTTPAAGSTAEGGAGQGRITGVVRRSAGQSVVWVDGQPRVLQPGAPESGAAARFESPSGRGAR